VYNCSGEVIGRVKAQDTEAEVTLFNKGRVEDVLLVLGKSGMIERFTVGISTVNTASREFDLVSSETQISVSGLPDPVFEETPLFETCAPLAVPYWASPMLSWPRGNYRDKLTDEFVNCSKMPTREEVLDALGADLFAAERTALSRDRFAEQLGKEGFVQILESSS
jgi:hypothetical protein